MRPEFSAIRHSDANCSSSYAMHHDIVALLRTTCRSTLLLWPVLWPV